MESSLQILALFLMVGVVVDIVWLMYCIQPVYRWMDRHFDFINYNYKERWDFLKHHDIIGKGYNIILNGYLLMLPAIVVAFVIPQLLFPKSAYIYGILVLLALTMPINIVYLRGMSLQPMQRELKTADMSRFIMFIPANIQLL